MHIRYLFGNLIRKQNFNVMSSQLLDYNIKVMNVYVIKLKKTASSDSTQKYYLKY